MAEPDCPQYEVLSCTVHASKGSGAAHLKRVMAKWSCFRWLFVDLHQSQLRLGICPPPRAASPEGLYWCQSPSFQPPCASLRSMVSSVDVDRIETDGDGAEQHVDPSEVKMLKTYAVHDVTTIQRYSFFSPIVLRFTRDGNELSSDVAARQYNILPDVLQNGEEACADHLWSCRIWGSVGLILHRRGGKEPIHLVFRSEVQATRAKAHIEQALRLRPQRHRAASTSPLALPFREEPSSIPPRGSVSPDATTTVAVRDPPAGGHLRLRPLDSSGAFKSWRVCVACADGMKHELVTSSDSVPSSVYLQRRTSGIFDTLREKFHGPTRPLQLNREGLVAEDLYPFSGKEFKLSCVVKDLSGREWGGLDGSVRVLSDKPDTGLLLLEAKAKTREEKVEWLRWVKSLSPPPPHATEERTSSVPHDSPFQRAHTREQSEGDRSPPSPLPISTFSQVMHAPPMLVPVESDASLPFPMTLVPPQQEASAEFSALQMKKDASSLPHLLASHSEPVEKKPEAQEVVAVEVTDNQSATGSPHLRVCGTAPGFSVDGNCSEGRFPATVTDGDSLVKRSGDELPSASVEMGGSQVGTNKNAPITTEEAAPQMGSGSTFEVEVMKDVKKPTGHSIHRRHRRVHAAALDGGAEANPLSHNEGENVSIAKSSAAHVDPCDPLSDVEKAAWLPRFGEPIWIPYSRMNDDDDDAVSFDFDSSEIPALPHKERVWSQ